MNLTTTFVFSSLGLLTTTLLPTSEVGASDLVVYIPLIYEVAYLVLIDAGELQIWGVAFVVTETLALALFVFIYYLFPRFINSIWFRRKGRASWYF